MSQFKALFDLPTHLICIIDNEGKFVDTNSAQKAILGLDPKELIGTPVNSHVHPDDADRTVQTIGKLFSEGGVVTDFRNRTRHQDGSYRWISWSAGLQNGQIVAIGTDITAQVVAEEKIKFSEQQYEVLFESMPILAGMSDNDSNPSFVNSTWLKYFGVTNQSEVTREFITSAIHPDDVNRFYIEGPAKRKMGVPFSFNIRIRRHDGLYRWHLYRSVPLKDATGKIQRWLNTGADIHDQIAAQSQIENLFMEAPAYITINKGPEHVYLLSNELNNKAVGRTDLEGKTVKEVFGEDADQILSVLDNVFKTGKPFRVGEFPVKRVWEEGQAPSTRYLSSVVQPTHDENGKIDGVMTFSVDVTAQVEARNHLSNAKIKAEAASKAKTEFVANMSHEIRTPLTAILGFSEISLDLPGIDERLKRYLDRIKSNGQQLLGLIGDILDLSKVEATGVEVKLAQINLKSFIQDLVDSMQSLAAAKGLSLKVSFDTKLRTQFVSDPQLIRQILQNLVGNAIKFTEHGSVEVRVAEDKSQLFFDIIDSGLGISKEQVEKLFVPFSQVDSSMSRKHRGTGLGLALARTFARALNGDISVADTSLGKGSCFRVTIEDQDSNFTPTKEEALIVELENTVVNRVLLVEDSADNQYLVSKFLSKAGVPMDIAGNGQEAIDKCQDNTYDLILMDIQMPIMDGYSTTEYLRKKGYKGKIVALTAHALSEEKERALRSGFDGYLTKPLQRELLLKLVQS